MSDNENKIRKTNRLITVTNPDDKTISYQYDANGNRTQLTAPEY